MINSPSAAEGAYVGEPGFIDRIGRAIGTKMRGVKGVDRLLRTLHDPDRRQHDYFRTIAQGLPDGPRYHLESRWFTEWTTWFYGSQDKAIHQWIQRNVQPGWVTFDIGANFGYFACLMAARGAAVHAFERCHGWQSAPAQTLL